MKKFVCTLLLLFIVGCGVDYSGYSNYSPYTGFSSHFKTTSGTSNLAYGYKDPPILDSNDPLAKIEFKESAQDYIDAVVNDLKEINDKADNATEKINAVVNAVNFGFEFFSLSYVGSVFTFTSNSNFEFIGYPEFPDFNYFYLPPTKPYKPFFLDNEFAVNSYNADVRRYNRELADFSATIKAYIEDAEHYIENCKNDYDMIRNKGKNYISYLEALSDKRVDLANHLFNFIYEDSKETAKNVPKETRKRNGFSSGKGKIDFVVGATKCAQCGRDIGEDETFCLYKLKRVCPECFRELEK